VLAAALSAAGCERTPEAGVLDAVHARSPERIEVREIAAGATFGQILWAAGLEPTEHHNLLLAFGEQANPRRMHAGTEVRIRRLGDAERVVRVEVDLDRDRTVHLERAGTGWRSSTVTVTTTTDTILAAGEIRSSLWSAVVGLEHPDLGEAVAAFVVAEPGASGSGRPSQVRSASGNRPT